MRLLPTQLALAQEVHGGNDTCVSLAVGHACHWRIPGAGVLPAAAAASMLSSTGGLISVAAVYNGPLPFFKSS